MKTEAVNSNKQPLLDRERWRRDNVPPRTRLPPLDGGSLIGDNGEGSVHSQRAHQTTRMEP